MRVRPFSALNTLVALVLLIAATGCDSDDPVSPPPPGASPVWSEITNLIPAPTLYGVWAPRADLIIGVGRDGAIWQRDSRQWTQRVSPTGRDLFAIAGSTTGSVVAVGDNGTVLEQVQGSFTLRTTPTQERLHGVWRSNADTFVAVGDNGVVIRGSGSTWAADVTPARSPLMSVWGASDDDIFAVGADGVILHYDGSQWNQMQSPVSEILSSVSGTSGSDVYAAGGAGAILHYDGTGWQKMTSPATGPVQSICADCGPAAAAGANGDVMRLIDGSWRSERLTGEPWLYAIARADTDLWAIGAHALYKHDGSAWSSETRGTIPILRAIASTPEQGLIVAGDNGSVMLGGTEEWRFEDIGALHRLNAAWASPAGDVFAAGTNRIFRHAGDRWVIENQEVIEYFDIGGNDQHTFAVGSSGAVRRRIGTSWHFMEGTSPSHALHAIRMSDMGGTEGYAVGEYGTILYFEGGGWQVKYTRPGAVLWDVAPVASARWNAVAVGAGGLSLGRSADVGGWVTMTTNVTTTLYSLAFGPGDNLFAVGANGTVLRLVDDEWTTVTSPTSRTLLKAYSRNGVLFACGGNTTAGGALFRYGPPDP